MSRVALLLLVACSNPRTRYGFDCPDVAIPDEPSLACTGLYGEGGENWKTRKLAPDVKPYTPALAQWVDGLDAARFMRLPFGKDIDKRDPDEWVFPVGTQFWQELSVEGRAVETRYLVKITSDAWFRSTYEWNADGSDARVVLMGRPQVKGVMQGFYEIPSQKMCDACHDGRKDHVLGYSALGTSTDAIPGDELDKRALGYLHINCGVACHNDNTGLTDLADLPIDMRLNLSVATELSVEATPVALTAFDKPASFTPVEDMRAMLRINTQTPSESAVLFRMSTRVRAEQMPPIVTHVVDRDAVKMMREWLDRLR